MPAKSKKQEKFMQAVANNPAFAKKVGVPQSVGKEFTMKKATAAGKAMKKVSADTKGRAMKKMADGGTTAVNPRVAKLNDRATAMNTKFTTKIADMNARKAQMPTARQAAFGERIADRRARFNDRVADLRARATAMGAAGQRQRDTGVGTGGAGGQKVLKKGGAAKKAMGGKCYADGGMVNRAVIATPKPVKSSGRMGTVKARGAEVTGAGRAAGMAKGGLTAGHKAADGVAKKGKTKGKEVAMKKGGYMKGGKC